MAGPRARRAGRRGRPVAAEHDEAADWVTSRILDSEPVAAGADGADAGKAMAEAIQGRRAVPTQPLGKHREQLLYNLLQLSAAMYRPNRLWQPLLELLNRRKLAGEFLGSDLRASLRAALIGNQGDGPRGVVVEDGQGPGGLSAGHSGYAYYGALMLRRWTGGRPSPVVKDSLSLAAADLESDFDLRPGSWNCCGPSPPRFLETAPVGIAISSSWPTNSMADLDVFLRHMFPRFTEPGR